MRHGPFRNAQTSRRQWDPPYHMRLIWLDFKESVNAWRQFFMPGDTWFALTEISSFFHFLGPWNSHHFPYNLERQISSSLCFPSPFRKGSQPFLPFTYCFTEPGQVSSKSDMNRCPSHLLSVYSLSNTLKFILPRFAELETAEFLNPYEFLSTLRKCFEPAVCMTHEEPTLPWRSPRAYSGVYVEIWLKLT